jgi:hypothetical protein
MAIRQTMASITARPLTEVAREDWDTSRRPPLNIRTHSTRSRKVTTDFVTIHRVTRAPWAGSMGQSVTALQDIDDRTVR